MGGQQRTCSARRIVSEGKLPLPAGMGDGFAVDGTSHLVKWILLTPAIWPQIPEGISRRGTPTKFHPGGWLPNWISPDSGEVLLQTISFEERRSRRTLNYGGKGYSSTPNISARLVAAMVGKAVPVTGYALPIEGDVEREGGGAKSAHLAVPAGSVYYFEAGTADDAVKLAAALNWHGRDKDFRAIGNRRSTVMGEKGLDRHLRIVEVSQRGRPRTFFAVTRPPFNG